MGTTCDCSERVDVGWMPPHLTVSTCNTHTHICTHAQMTACTCNDSCIHACTHTQYIYIYIPLAAFASRSTLEMFNGGRVGGASADAAEARPPSVHLAELVALPATAVDLAAILPRAVLGPQALPPTLAPFRVRSDPCLHMPR